MNYRDDIERLCRSLRERERDLRDELCSLPEGEFYASDTDGRRKYYQRFRREGNRKKERRRGIKGDPVLIKDLVRKKYVTEALSRLEKDIVEAERMLKLYVPTDENSVMEVFISNYPELADCIFKVTSASGKLAGFCRCRFGRNSRCRLSVVFARPFVERVSVEGRRLGLVSPVRGLPFCCFRTLF